MTGAEVRCFACTACGKCCNRSPEVELSEAAALADVFVFRLMFRLYWLPRNLADYLASSGHGPNAGEVFYQKKRLLSAFAARKVPVKLRRDEKAVEYTKYLMISALSVDTGTGACAAQTDKRCGIYGRRPLSCRSVPFHYSRAEGLAVRDLDAFVSTAGYECDTGEGAEVVIEHDRIVDRATLQARAEAMSVAERDRPWHEAIVRRMHGGTAPLPTFDDIEANAQFGATTTSMRVAWQIAADCGLIAPEDCEALIAAQLELIDSELAGSAYAQDARETLSEMQAEYRHELTRHRERRIAVS
jgi:Fe-S-cluster containining protein